VGPNCIIYDCEIINAIPNRDGSKLKGIAYCAGWRDFENMGVSVTGVYDYVEDRYRVFCDDNKAELAELIHGRKALCVGFNNIPFDNRLLFAAGWPCPNDEMSYDLLREIWIAAGLPPTFDHKTHGGFGLDAVCEKNFGTKKTGSGALAPVLWQHGQKGQVIDYCLNDIRLTKQLFDDVLQEKNIINPKSGLPLRLRKP
jgi:hypothetical protein